MCGQQADMRGDRGFIQIVDAALAEAARKSGAWLVCRPGCSECCLGPFPITQLDAERLREGLAELQAGDPARAARVRRRAGDAVARMPEFAAGLAYDDAEFEARLASLPDEEPCPVLDPDTGTCDLYASRPVTCRTFGPPVRWGGDAVGVCELCFAGAGDEEIAACEVELDIVDREAALVRERERLTGAKGQTLVALALINRPVRSPVST
jgi:Fe-S-cluster containining protein